MLKFAKICKINFQEKNCQETKKEGMKQLTWKMNEQHKEANIINKTRNQ